MLNEPHEKFNLHPALVSPKVKPGFVWRLIIKVNENELCFLEVKNPLIIVAPSQLIMALIF